MAETGKNNKSETTKKNDKKLVNKPIKDNSKKSTSKPAKRKSPPPSSKSSKTPPKSNPKKTSSTPTATHSSVQNQNGKDTRQSVSVQDESETRIKQLALILSGEKKLKDQQKEIERLKEEAKEMQMDLVRKDVEQKTAVIETPPTFTPDEISATGGAQKVVQKLELYKWEAPIRVQFPFDTKLFIGIVVLSLVFILYLAILGQYGLMFVIIALLFFIYVAGTTEPLEVEHSITTRGIDSLDKLYEWYMLEKFWFTRKNDQYLLIVDTRLRTPARLMMIIDKKDITPIFILLQDKLLYRDIRKQKKLHKATYGEYIPLEKI